MMNDLRRRKIDVVVVWALDRLARSLKQLLSIAEECRAMGVDLVSLKQNVDTTLPAGRLTFQVLGALAEFEREMLRERVKAGMAQARRSGKHVGRPARRTFHTDEIGRMRLLRSQGMSIRKLAMEFDTPVDGWETDRRNGHPQDESSNLQLRMASWIVREPGT